MSGNSELKIIDSGEILKQKFEQENDNEYINKIPRRRAMGGETFSEQLVFDHVDIQVPILFGAHIYEHSIQKVFCQVKPGLNHEFPHIVFNGGKYQGIHFSNFRLSSIENNNAAQFVYIPDLTLEINGGDFFEPIRFSNSKFGNIKITGGTFHSEVCFERGVYGQVEISGGNFKKGLYFGQLVEFDTYSRLHVHLPPDAAPAWTSTENGIYNSIKITGGIEGKEINFDKCFIKNDLTFKTKGVDISVSNSTSVGSIELGEGNCSIKSSKTNKLTLGGKRIVSKITADFVSVTCNDLEFEGYNGKDSIISFLDLKANSYKFRSFINYGTITFNRCQLIDLVENFGSIRPLETAQALNENGFKSMLFQAMLRQDGEAINRIREIYRDALLPPDLIETSSAGATLNFENSDIGKTAFFACEISNSELFFQNSKLTELFLAGTKLPHYHNIVAFPETEQKRLALSQIKKIYENRGDHVIAGQYLFEEMEVLRSEANSIEKKNLNNLDERISLCLNYESNRHGQNWIPAFLWLLSIGLFVWLVICLTIFKIPVINKDSMKIFLSSISYFIQFLLPIHKFTLLEEFAGKVGGFGELKNPPAWVYSVMTIFDAIWRIISGYLVYQLIAAFRKHGKR